MQEKVSKGNTRRIRTTGETMLLLGTRRNPVIRSEEAPQLTSIPLGEKAQTIFGYISSGLVNRRPAVAASLDLTARRWDMGRTGHGQT
jgi:hypothetical protein